MSRYHHKLQVKMKMMRLQLLLTIGCLFSPLAVYADVAPTAFVGCRASNVQPSSREFCRGDLTNSIQRQCDNQSISILALGARRGNNCPDMRNCRSMEELVGMANANLNTMTPRNLSGFWTVTAKLSRNKIGPPAQETVKQQLDTILDYTLEDIQRFGCRDVAQTTLGIAKIVKNTNDQRTHSINRVYHPVFIGNGGERKDLIFSKLAAGSMPILSQFDPRHLSNLIYAFGLVKYNFQYQDGSTLFDVLGEEAIPSLGKFNGQDMSNMLWAYANIGVSNVELFEKAGEVISKRDSLEDFKPQNLANIVWSYATVKESHPKLFKEVGDHIVKLDNLQRFDPQALSNIVWSYSTSKESHPKLFKEVGDHVVKLDNLQTCKPQELSNIVWAYTTANESHPKLFKTVGDYIVRLDSLQTFKPQHLANIVWAYETSKESHPKLSKKVGDHIVQLDNLQSFDPQALSNIVWSYATLDVPHPKLFKKVGDHIVELDNLQPFKPQELSNIVWSYATAKESHPKLFKKVGDHVVKLDNLQTFKPQELSNIVWAYATAKVSNPDLFQKVAKAAIEKQKEFDEQGIANLLWAFATSGQLDHHLFKSLSPAAVALVGKYKCQGLTNIAWAYAVADVASPSLFNDDFVKACAKKEHHFIPEELCQLHQWTLWAKELKSDIRLPVSLEKKCHDAFSSEEPSPSALQNDVVTQLKAIGLDPEEEVLTESGYCIDAIVKMNENRVAVEVDGPSHFIGRKPTGNTILKHRQVASLDKLRVVSVPYWEWNKLKKASGKKQEYLRNLLGMG